MGLAESFPVLVDKMLRTHHDGAESRMSQASRGDLPQSTIWRWRRGLPKTYDPNLIRKFCLMHALDFIEVMDLIDKDRRIWLTGKRVPLPDISDIRRGPVPAQDKRRKRSKALLLAAGAMLLSGATQAVAAQPKSSSTPGKITSESKYYVKPRRHHRGSGNTRSRRRGFPHKHAA